MKKLPTGFVDFVGEALGSSKGKGVQHWVDNIIYTQQVNGHLDVVRQMSEKLSVVGLSVSFSKSWWCSLQQDFVAWWWIG